jgi:hypothetical protein
VSEGCLLCGYAELIFNRTTAVCKKCGFHVYIGINYCSVDGCTEYAMVNYNTSLKKFLPKCSKHGYVKAKVYLK